MQLFSDNSENLDKLVTTLGQLFQIWNDLVTLKSEKVNIKCFWIDGFFLLLLQQTLANSYCADITEGTFTFPIIHAIQTHPHDDKIISILFNIYKIKKIYIF
jgi:geranylgeranyl diphosphate synthase type 3